MNARKDIDAAIRQTRRELPESLPDGFAESVISLIGHAARPENVLPVFASAGGFAVAAVVAILVSGAVGIHAEANAVKSDRPDLDLFTHGAGSLHFVSR